MKKGQYTVESYMIVNGKAGDIFYTEKSSKHLTALSTHHNRKIVTEKIIIVIPYNKEPKAKYLTRVTLL